MINKKFVLIAFSLIFLASSMQAVAITYPSKKMLQKTDHILSLTITASLCSALIADAHEANNVSFLLKKLCLAVMGVNSIANALMLKHERSAAVASKILLSTITFAGHIGLKIMPNDSYMSYAAFIGICLGLSGNGIKNIWDIYSLARSEQSEGIQND